MHFKRHKLLQYQFWWSPTESRIKVLIVFNILHEFFGGPLDNASVLVVKGMLESLHDLGGFLSVFLVCLEFLFESGQHSFAFWFFFDCFLLSWCLLLIIRLCLFLGNLFGVFANEALLLGHLFFLLFLFT